MGYGTWETVEDYTFAILWQVVEVACDEVNHLVVWNQVTTRDEFANFPASTVEVPGIDWGTLTLIWAKVPVGIFAFLLVGLCTSVMWGGIFNMAVEGLGKYTAVASGIFMTMVFGCAVMLAIQAQVAEMTDYMTSYWVVMFCAAYILFYALIGSKPAKK